MARGGKYEGIGFEKIKIQMTIGQEFLKELLLESEVTRRYLVSVPFEKKNFKPAEKSESLGRLAIHCLLYTSPSPRDQRGSRMPSSA